MTRSAAGNDRIRASWRADRSYLLAIAAAMLTRPADAEEVVQEAFARLSAAAVDEVDDTRGWLVVVVRRLCLDRLGSAEAQRTTTTWSTPEPAQPSVDPADRVTLDDEVRQALAVVLDRLSPAERTSFLLHDIFGFPFDAIAELVGRTPASCRQLARRARLAIRSGSFHAESPTTAPPAPQEAAELAERFIAVCDGGDVRELVSLLDPEVAGHVTVIGRGLLVPIRGVDAVAQRLMSFFGPAAGVRLEPFSLEGTPALVARSGGHVVAVVRLDVRSGRVVHLEGVARPFLRQPR